jgi:hypothetical protein
MRRFNAVYARAVALGMGWCPGFDVRHVTDIKRQANVEIKTTLAINKLLVSVDSEIRPECDIEIVRISESGH